VICYSKCYSIATPFVGEGAAEHLFLVSPKQLVGSRCWQPEESTVPLPRGSPGTGNTRSTCSRSRSPATNTSRTKAVDACAASYRRLRAALRSSRACGISGPLPFPELAAFKPAIKNLARLVRLTRAVRPSCPSPRISEARSSFN
jgi:hypothetical protein